MYTLKVNQYTHVWFLYEKQSELSIWPTVCFCGTCRVCTCELVVRENSELSWLIVYELRTTHKSKLLVRSKSMWVCVYLHITLLCELERERDRRKTRTYILLHSLWGDHASVVVVCQRTRTSNNKHTELKLNQSQVSAAEPSVILFAFYRVKEENVRASK